MHRIRNEGIFPNSSDGTVPVELRLRQEPDEDDEDDEDNGDGRDEEDDDEGTDDGYSE